MASSPAGRLDFVPIVPAISHPLPEATAVPARSSPSIEIELAGAMLSVAPGTDPDFLTTALRAIRA
jgi:transposase